MFGRSRTTPSKFKLLETKFPLWNVMPRPLKPMVKERRVRLSRILLVSERMRQRKTTHVTTLVPRIKERLLPLYVPKGVVTQTLLLVSRSTSGYHEEQVWICDGQGTVGRTSRGRFLFYCAQRSTGTLPSTGSRSGMIND